MPNSIGIVVFEDAEELDFVGPWEAFTMANLVLRNSTFAAGFGIEADPERVVDDVRLVSETGGTIRCAKGMRVETDSSFDDCPPLDVVLVPGGFGTRREVENPRMLEFLARAATTCTWVTSVCTGSLLLGAAGPARGKRVTTHWTFVDALRERGDVSEVLEDVRYVRDGNVVTAAGVSAGIDMALWLTGQLHGENLARATQKGMEYYPAPPYAALV